MKLLDHQGNDPYVNVALEECLLKGYPEEVVILWSSAPSVVIGKHQNAYAEVNFPYVYREGIPLLRRLSGGGTVYHGPGNLNYTLIRRGEPGRMVDFRKHTFPVVSFLNQLGVPARFEGKNDIRVNGLKVSGNAEHVYKDRLIHHGTLLYDARLQELNHSIRVREGRYLDKSVQSVRSSVANISDYLPHPPPFDVFRRQLRDFLADYYRADSLTGLDETMQKAARSLADSKYRKWEWNMAYSPPYHFRGDAFWKGREIRLDMRVKSGLIEQAAFSGEGSHPGWVAMEKAMKGTRHEAASLLGLLAEHGFVEGSASRLPDFALHLFF